MGTQASTSSDSIVGRLVVEHGLASPEEVQACLEKLQRDADRSSMAGQPAMADASAMADATPEAPSPDSSSDSTQMPAASSSDSNVQVNPNQSMLGQVLVEQGVVTRKQLDRLKPEIEAAKPTQQIPGYQIKRKLGAGAMASVYMAKQVSLDRMVAIKILPRQHTDNEDFVKRFHDEGKAAAKLNHPNIVQAIDVGRAGEFHYFVMELVNGRTVFDDLASNKRYLEAEALDIVIQIAKALEHAHKAGFIHRDVKPKNIMITEDGIAKLADMGLARAVSDREAAEAEKGKAFGTPYYIAPEQIRGETDIDFRVDIYGLGATFYHMVTGQVPFEGPNPSAVMHRHLKSRLTPPDHINPNLSLGIGEIIEVCMAKDRNERYSNTSELLEDLQAVAAGQPPTQARRKFDLSSLASLEQEAEDSSLGAGGGSGSDQNVPLLEQPIFWVALAGWAVAAIAIVIAIVT